MHLSTTLPDPTPLRPTASPDKTLRNTSGVTSYFSIDNEIKENIYLYYFGNNSLNITFPT